jgi:predicted nucleotidyltransferase
MVELLDRLKILSEHFYEKHKTRIISIILSGSLGRGTRKNIAPKSDIDITIISRLYYDLFIERGFRTFLEKRINGLEYDVGVLPESRLVDGRDKSLYLYDLKHSSKVLAGKDVLSEIPRITVEDMYPLEGFRLILNRAFDLIMSVKSMSGQVIETDPEFFGRAKRRILRAHIDSFLIFCKCYHPHIETRNNIFLKLGKTLPEIRDFDDARDVLLMSLRNGLEITGIHSLSSFLMQLEQECSYPLLFRIFTVFRTKRIDAFLKNPIYETFQEGILFLERKSPAPNDEQEILRLVQTFKSCPQPILRRKVTG